jgi:hypothetical protein
MGYAFAVFPKSGSARRPQETMVDRIFGGLALAILLAAAGGAVWALWQ